MTQHRHVFPVMGTMASLVIAGHVPSVDAARAHEACAASLSADEQRFSHFRADSEIIRWERGDQIDIDAAAEIEAVVAACLDLQVESAGVFTAIDPRTGRLDTAGYVKGYAIGKAVERIRAVGVHDFTLNVGGDSYSGGRPGPDRPWRVAITDPHRPRAICAIVEASDRAVATSGDAERGAHIWLGARPAASGLRSFTVVGPDVARADAFATIGFAMGEPGLAWVARHPGYAALAVRADGSVVGDVALVSAA